MFQNIYVFLFQSIPLTLMSLTLPTFIKGVPVEKLVPQFDKGKILNFLSGYTLTSLAKVYQINEVCFKEKIEKYLLFFPKKLSEAVQEDIFRSRQKIRRQSIAQLMELIGEPSRKYPSGLYKKDIAYAYNLTKNQLHHYIWGSEVLSIEEQKIYRDSYVFFPAMLEAIQKDFGTPDISFIEAKAIAYNRKMAQMKKARNSQGTHH